MKVQRLERKQLVKTSLEEAWDFFSNPRNLSKITPAYMRFEITSDFIKYRMYPGQIITYKVRPLLGIPLHWMTEITQIRDLQFFIDEQRVGPYQIWHHQHHFKDTPEGVLMTDIVHYKISNWLTGALADKLIVKKQLNDIFDYRMKKVDEIFNASDFNLSKKNIQQKVIELNP